jgi:hypothetical protein
MESVFAIPSLDQIKRGLDVLFNGQDIIELRTIRTGDKPQHGYYTDRDKLATDVFGRSADAQTNCYVVLNELRPEMSSTVTNDMGTGECTKDIHILRRKWVLVDVDPARTPGTSATAAEKECARQTARSIMVWLRTQGFPDPVVVDSGNGVHLLYPVDLDNTPTMKAIVKKFLQHLAARFDTAAVTIDQSVFNAARISKLPGTVARKGQHSDDRPHRTAQLLHVPDCLEAVDVVLLQQVAGNTESDPPPAQPDTPAADRWDIPGLLKQHDLAYQHRPGYDTEAGPADLYQLQECPWSVEHTSGPGGAAIIQFPSGAVSFRCQHSHCANRTWQDFKAALGFPDVDVDDLVFGTSPAVAGVADFQVDPPRPELADIAFHGVLGEFAQAAGAHTESDPAAVLMQLQVMFGVVAGRNAFFTVAGTRHYPKLFLAVCGKTSKGRKGLALDVGAQFILQAYPDFEELRRGGLSTGEGVISVVRDASYGTDKKGEVICLHPGVDDKRGLFVEPELAGVFARMSREGNSLCAVLRDCWDDKTLHVTTRKDPLQATVSHLGVIGHITPTELREALRPADVYNGLGNRFLWCYSERSRRLSRGGDIPPDLVLSLGGRLRDSLEFAQQVWTVDMSDDAWQAWDALYEALDADQDDAVMEGLSSRAAAQVRRLAMIYALADGTCEVQLSHLQAAVACFEYSRETLEHCYVSGLDNEEAQDILTRVLSRLRTGPATRTDISNLFQRHLPAAKLRAVLAAAELRGLIHKRKDDTGGRPSEIFSTP